MFENYNIQLDKGLSYTGESRSYFAYRRVEIIYDVLSSFEVKIEKILDFGCGDGSTLPFLDQFFQPKYILGMDIENTLRLDLRRKDRTTYQFIPNVNSHYQSGYNLIYTNGVFHHIEPELRYQNLQQIYNMLETGGYFAFWENNPWNIGTQLVMSRIPFDKDAKKINILNARSLLERVGLEIVCIKFAFIFPRFLKLLRPLEYLVDSLPLGGQYVILAQKI